MKLQALISWQVSKNQLQQENEKRRETNFDKKKGKIKTLNRKGNGQSTSSPCSSHFILLPTTPPPTTPAFLSSVQYARETELAQEEAQIRKLHKTQTLKIIP
jgi:hypothetical protein